MNLHEQTIEFSALYIHTIIPISLRSEKNVLNNYIVVFLLILHPSL